MANNIYGVGLRNVGSYQVAGTPYLTASNLSNEEKLFEFPNVTKKIVVENTGSNDVYLYFYPSSSASNMLIIPTTKKIEMDVKCILLYASSSQGDPTGIQIFAELTNIPTSKMYSLTGLEGV
jgi:hypothetical protein